MKNALTLSLLTAALFVLSFPNAFADCTYAHTLSAEAYEMGNLIAWSTNSETNNRHFLVERSTDGVSFSIIGTVKGNGTTQTAHNYQFLDVAALQGASFYRLKQVDTDGNYTYSTTTTAYKRDGNNFTVVSITPPDEKTNVFELTVNAIAEETMDYKLYDMDGNLIYQQKQSLRKGINIISVDFTEIQPADGVLGFADSSTMLGDKVGYKVALKGSKETEHLNIAPRSVNVLANARPE